MLHEHFNYYLHFFIGDLSCQLLRVIRNIYDNAGHPANYLTHQHPFLELHYMVQGRCAYSAGDTLYEVTPNRLLLIPPNTGHTLRQVSASRCHMFLSMQIQPPPKQAGAPSHALYNALHPSAPILLDIPQKSILAEALQHISDLSETRRNTFSAQEAMRSYANLLMAGLAEALIEAPAAASSAPTIAPQSFLIDQFFCYPSAMKGGADALAGMLNVSPRQLDRILLASYGMNFREKLNQTKLNYTMDLLTNRNLSIAQIASILNYSSSTAFGAFIKTATGKTPTQLRRELLSEPFDD